MWHIFPRGEHMEIEYLRLDFQPIHIKEKPTQNISEKNPEKEEKKKIRTKREEPRSEKREKESGESSQLTSPARPGAGVAWARAQKQVASDPGRRRPRPRGLGRAPGLKRLGS